MRCNGVESCDAGVGGGSGGIIQVECNDTRACNGPVSAAATDVRVFCNGQDSCGSRVECNSDRCEVRCNGKNTCGDVNCNSGQQVGDC